MLPCLVRVSKEVAVLRGTVTSFICGLLMKKAEATKPFARRKGFAQKEALAQELIPALKLKPRFLLVITSNRQ